MDMKSRGVGELGLRKDSSELLQKSEQKISIADRETATNFSTLPKSLHPLSTKKMFGEDSHVASFTEISPRPVAEMLAGGREPVKPYFEDYEPVKVDNFESSEGHKIHTHDPLVLDIAGEEMIDDGEHLQFVNGTYDLRNKNVNSKSQNAILSRGAKRMQQTTLPSKFSLHKSRKLDGFTSEPAHHPQ